MFLHPPAATLQFLHPPPATLQLLHQLLPSYTNHPPTFLLLHPSSNCDPPCVLLHLRPSCLNYIHPSPGTHPLTQLLLPFSVFLHPCTHCCPGVTPPPARAFPAVLPTHSFLLVFVLGAPFLRLPSGRHVSTFPTRHMTVQRSPVAVPLAVRSRQVFHPEYVSYDVVLWIRHQVNCFHNQPNSRSGFSLRGSMRSPPNPD